MRKTKNDKPITYTVCFENTNSYCEKDFNDKISATIYFDSLNYENKNIKIKGEITWYLNQRI